MKRMICTLGIFLYAGVVCAQQEEHVFVIEGDSIRCNSEYVEPLYFDYQDEECSLYKTIPVRLGNGVAYVVNLYNYDVAQRDGGDFRMIEVMMNERPVFCLKQSDGWVSLDDSTCFDVVPLAEGSAALLFKGFPYPCEPELLTIIALHKDGAKLVFNKHFVWAARERGREGYSLVLHDGFAKYGADGEQLNQVAKYKVWEEHGTLMFGGSYGEVVKGAYNNMTAEEVFDLLFGGQIRYLQETFGGELPSINE